MDVADKHLKEEDEGRRNEIIDAGREMCIGLLLSCRSELDESVDLDMLKRIDDCLVCTHAELIDTNGLITFLNEMAPFYYDVDAAVGMLHARGAFYAQSLVYRCARRIKEYLQTSLDILSGVSKDDLFVGGIRELVDAFVVNVHREEIDKTTFWTFSKVFRIVLLLQEDR